MQILIFLMLLVLFSKKIKFLLKMTTLQKNIVEEKLDGTDRDGIGNLEDFLRLVLVNEECWNPKVVVRLTFLLVARCSLLFAHCSLLFAGCSLFFALYSLFFPRCLLRFARWSLLFACCSLFFRPNYCEIKLLCAAKKWFEYNETPTQIFPCKFLRFW